VFKCQICEEQEVASRLAQCGECQWVTDQMAVIAIEMEAAGF
jgi:hypothetical protein